VSVTLVQKNGGGSIVNLSSISGFIGQPFTHMGCNVAKAAIRMLTKSAAVQYAKDGILVNSVHLASCRCARRRLSTQMRTSGGFLAM